MLAPSHVYVKVMRKDIDYLVILIGLCIPHTKNVFLLKQIKGKVIQTLCNPHLAADKTLSDLKLFPHVMSKCDFTFALFIQEKMKFIKVKITLTCNKSLVFSKTLKLTKTKEH